MRKRKIIIYVIVLVGFVVINKIAYDYLDKNYVPDSQIVEETAETDGESTDPTPAVDFTVKDTAGKDVKLSSFYGKTIILNFWASWCSNCAKQLVIYQNLYADYGEDVVFFMVNVTDGVKETNKSAKEYIDDKGYTFPVYFDEDFEASLAYGATAIPMTYIIDKDGNLAAYGKGTISEESLRSYLTSLSE
ncbi:MAG: TlpA disulfide reductase family protein [Erysipelotrichaceae bacterium]|nr:TlpA disulfide reductase family protein [Erysipelotrichaceae bacterium]